MVINNNWLINYGTNVTGTATVTFPRSFSNNKYCAIFTPNASGGTMTGGCIESKTVSTMKLHACYRTGDNQGPSGVTSSWICFGY